MKVKDLLSRPVFQVALLLPIVFTIDLVIPLGVAIGVLYVFCIALLLRENTKTLLLFSITISFLIVLKLILIVDSQTTWMVFVNRGISVGSIFVISVITIRHSNLVRKLELYSTQLESKNKELEQLTHIVSHDLKSPINNISSLTNLLKEILIGKLDHESSNILHLIEESSHRMKVLVEDILDFALIGKKKEIASVDCNQLLNDIKVDLSQAIEDANAQVNISNLPTISGYKTELRQLFQNIISNALKFHKSDVNSRIDMTADKENGKWHFTIQDNGIGIDKKNSDKIFSAFVRLHGKEDYEGIGIGLANCKKIVELHYGKIYVESKLRQGSTFHIILPNQPTP